MKKSYGRPVLVALLFSLCLVVPPFLAAEEAVDIHALIAALASPDVQVREKAARKLSDLGPGAQEAFPILLKATANPSETTAVRCNAMGAIAKMNVRPDQVVPTYSRLVHDPDVNVRGVAAIDLRIIDPHAGALALNLALQDPDKFVRRDAARMLVSFGPAAQNSIGPLGQVMTQDLDPFVRQAAAESLQELFRRGNISAQQFPVGAFAQMLKDPYAENQKLAASILQELGAAAGNAVPALVGLLHDKNPELRVVARDALKKIGTPEALAAYASFEQSVPEQFIPEQIEVLTTAPAEESARAAQALARIGPSAVPSFCELIASKDWTVAWRASLAIRVAAKKFPNDPIWADVVPCLRLGIKSPYPGVRMNMGEALRDLRLPATQELRSSFIYWEAWKGKYLRPYYNLRARFDHVTARWWLRMREVFLRWAGAFLNKKP